MMYLTLQKAGMPRIVRNILAMVTGIITGSVVNMSIIAVSGRIISPPDGVDVTTVESLKANMHLFEPKHFLMPFLAHALGTLAGACIAALAGATHKMRLAFVIGVFFLAGGIASVFMLPSPLWFTVVDLGLAYLPMAFFGWKVQQKLTS